MGKPVYIEPNSQKLIRKFQRKQSLIPQRRADYTRLRDIAVKRIKRAQSRGQLLSQEMPAKLSEIGDSPANLARAYAEVSQFLLSKRSTQTGRDEIQRAQMAKLKQYGYQIPDNEILWDKFGEFMRQFRVKYEYEEDKARRYRFDSNFAISIFDTMVETDKIKVTSNASSISRAFNNWLRENGLDDYVMTMKEAAKRRAAANKKNKKKAKK